MEQENRVDIYTDRSERTAEGGCALLYLVVKEIG